MASYSMRKEKIKELEIKNGGAIFSSDRAKGTHNPTLIIGLGGLGIRILNQLKGNFDKDVNKQNHVYFRAIDCEKRCLDAACKWGIDGSQNNTHYAHLEQNELISVYNSGIALMLKKENLPPTIAEWLNVELIGTELDNTGARMNRQIGRSMLVNDIVYPRVRQELENLIKELIAKSMPENTIEIILISGISGGLGSGTIIDLSYMIHDIFKHSRYSNYKLDGYLCMPDVQFLYQPIHEMAWIKESLMKNGYAALKEIDRFMNIQEMGELYELRLGARYISSDRNIFHGCHLISGRESDGSVRNIEDTIRCLAEYLMVRLNGGGTDDNGMRAPWSIDPCNTWHEQYLWLMNHPLRKIYHRNATYKYETFGHSSVIFPKKEILFYCAKGLFQRLIEHFNCDSLSVKKKVLQIYKETHLLQLEDLFNYAININSENPIIRTIETEGYSKRMIRQNPNIAYEDACVIARYESSKINSSYLHDLEENLFQSLKLQIEEIFDKYGPYTASEAIVHKKSPEGDFEESFSGIVERLHILQEECLKCANKARRSYIDGGADAIFRESEKVRKKLFGWHETADQYISTCNRIAIATTVDFRIYDALALVLGNVASNLEKLNFSIYKDYICTLNEVNQILETDSLLTAEHELHTFTRDILSTNANKEQKLKTYLNSFMDFVDIGALAKEFNRSMKNNPDKWIWVGNKYHYDPVSEIRRLLDDCMVKYGMNQNLTEKLFYVAHHPNFLSFNDLSTFGAGNYSMQVFMEVAQEIFNNLLYKIRPIQCTSRISMDEFYKHSALYLPRHTPIISSLLKEMAQQRGIPVFYTDYGTSFSLQQYYWGLPLYALSGMSEYNDVYKKHKSPGMHMDERKENWYAYPNPYTIDSVANDIIESGKPRKTIESEEEYKLLMDVVNQVKDGIYKYQFIELAENNTTDGKMFLYEIVNSPVDFELVEKHLYDVVYEEGEIDLLVFMEAHGFEFKKVEITAISTDIEVTLLNFADVSPEDMEEKYRDVPCGVTDIYKWIFKNMRYRKILEKNTIIFEKLYRVIDDSCCTWIGRTIPYCIKVKRTIEAFALVLQAGLIQINQKKTMTWSWNVGNEEICVELLETKRIQRKFYLYCLFKRFFEQTDYQIEEMCMAANKILEREECDISEIKFHIKEMLGEWYLGNRFNADRINEEAEFEAATDFFDVCEQREDIGNPFKVLKEFYSKINYYLLW